MTTAGISGDVRVPEELRPGQMSALVLPFPKDEWRGMSLDLAAAWEAGL